MPIFVNGMGIYIVQRLHSNLILHRLCSRLVPIIEPDISRDGDHDLNRSMEVSQFVLSTVYKALADYKVYLEGTVLKPSMVTSGTKCPQQATPDEVAHMTLLGGSI